VHYIIFIIFINSNSTTIILYTEINFDISYTVSYSRNFHLPVGYPPKNNIMIIVIIYDRPYMEKNQSFQYILLWYNNAVYEFIIAN